MLWEFLVIVAVLWWLQRKWLMRRQRALGKQLQTNLKIWPIIGHAYKCVGSGEEKMEEIVRSAGKDAIALGGISKCCLYDQVYACIADPAIAQLVMSKCLEKHAIMKLMNFLIGNSSIIATVPIWRRRRRMIIPFFKTKNLVEFFNIFLKHSTEKINLLEQKASKGTFSIWKNISTYASNSLFETIIGIKMNDKSEDFLNAVEELWNVMDYVVYRPWFWPKFMHYFMPSYKYYLGLRQEVCDFMSKTINENLIKLEANKSARKEAENTIGNSSFLDLQQQLPEIDRLTDEETLEETITLIVAGTDTSSTCIGFVILLLSRHVDVQDKVYKELEEVFEYSDRQISVEDLSRLKYLDAVIKETLRLYPPVPIIVRHVNKDVKLPSGITLVEGCGILINIWAVHRNPTYWGDDAEQFRPERFLNYTPKHPAAFMAFSFGPRDCVGSRFAMMSIKTVLATLFRRYRVLPPPGVKQGDPPKTEYSLMMKHAENYCVQLEQRKQI